MIRPIALIAVAAALLAAGTSTAQLRPPPPAQQGTAVRNATGGAAQDRTSKSPPEALFVEKCGMCHRQMGMGTIVLARRMEPGVAMLEARTDLTRDYIVAAARGGIGNMPRLSRGEVSDAQLATIAGYLAKAKR